MTLLAVAAAAAAASCASVTPIRAIALRHGVVCLPNARSSHSLPTPRGGGIAFVVPVTIAWAVIAALYDNAALMAIAAAAAAVAVVGAVDDARGVPARVRLLVHLAAAASASWAATRGSATAGAAAWLPAGAVLAVGIAWMTSLFNFMDGINGLAASEGVFVAAGGAVLAAISGGTEAAVALALVAGGVAGFLPWNAPRARIFMGDAGSTWIGFTYAAVASAECARRPDMAPAWLVLPALFVADATVCLVRRAIRREDVLSAHRSHGYQNLARRFGSHSRVTAMFAMGNAVLGGAALLAAQERAHGWAVATLAYACAASAAIFARSGVPGVAELTDGGTTQAP